jgi:GTP-binding protein
VRNAGLFTVAILGKPNVGKSTLFNRLVGRPQAITHATAGVTRDRVEAELWFQDQRCLLVDTGGYTLEQGPITRLVARRTLETAAECDLLLLVVQASGLDGEDREFLHKLRRHRDKIVLVINKVDSERQERGLGEFFELGFPRLVALSAAHGRNVEELVQLVREAAGTRSAGAAGAQPEAKGAVAPARSLVRLAILGKPNTGKSTLVNRLLGEAKALVSEVAGTTRDPVTGVFQRGEHLFRVVDTAGIRRKSRVEEDVEYYSVHRAIRSIDEADVVLLLIDSAEGLTDQDKKIAALAARQGRGLILVLNKWDLPAGRQGGLAGARERVRFFFPVLDFVPILPASALTGQGVGELLEQVVAVWQQLHRKVATHELNRALRRWVEDYPLPVRGKNVKLRYATQTGVNPVRFVFFVNNRRAYPSAYNRYLTNRIRRELGFDRIPLFIDIRES